MDGEAFLIGMLVSLFLLAKLLGWLVERIGLPSFVGEILAGAIVINFTIGSFNLADYFGIDPYAVAQQSGLNFSALTIFFYLGLVFLVFTVGLKIRPSALRSVARSSLEIALVGVVVPFALGAAFVLLAIGDANLFAVLFIGQKRSFAKRIRALVQDGIDLVHAEVRHADVVGVRVREGDGNVRASGFINRPALSRKQHINLVRQFCGHGRIILCFPALRKIIHPENGSWTRMNAAIRC